MMIQIKKIEGQAIIEFTFAMLITVLLIVGMIKVFHWTGNELVERRRAHERELRIGNIDPTYFAPVAINATVSSNIFGTN